MSRYENGLVRQGSTIPLMADELVKGNDVVAVGREIIELIGKYSGTDGQGIFIPVIYLMVIQNQYFIGGGNLNIEQVIKPAHDQQADGSKSPDKRRDFFQAIHTLVCYLYSHKRRQKFLLLE